MGKYMRKAKVTCDVAVMEMGNNSPLGVRTRARTLALAKQAPSLDTSSYLELRSRRLEKVLVPPRKQQQKNPNCCPNFRKNPNSGPARLDSGELATRVFGEEGGETEESSVEPSCGENNLELDVRGRSTRESTPCSFLREPESAETPGSTTRQTFSTATNKISERSIPSSQEIEEFLASAEKEQQRLFAEKYNFDVVNDVPLSGRYEWIRVEQ